VKFSEIQKLHFFLVVIEHVAQSVLCHVFTDIADIVYEARSHGNGVVSSRRCFHSTIDEQRRFVLTAAVSPGKLMTANFTDTLA